MEAEQAAYQIVQLFRSKIQTTGSKILKPWHRRGVCTRAGDIAAVALMAWCPGANKLGCQPIKHPRSAILVAVEYL
jgi:hypothetical protein